MVKNLWLSLSVFLAVLFLIVPIADATVPVFNDSGFESTWARVDKPVQDGTTASRGYTWGPVAPGTEGLTSETYNAQLRKVQYFDKARMEVNNPQGNPKDLFYVTTGLLVKELVSGYRQDGDNTFTALPPSQVQVAGDTNEGGNNAIAPIYASFRNVGTFFQKENSRPKATGSLINSRINRAGTASTFNPPEQRLLKGFDDVTGHNIADVFTDYGNLTGLVWDGSQYTSDNVFFGLPLYVFGRPVTEPYWLRTLVKGQEQNVLVQLFERRVLTYTPSNPAGFKVEMGNVGQHYYRWRYVLNNIPAQTPTKSEFVAEFGRDGVGNKNPYYVAPDSQGNFYTASNNGNQLYRYDSQGNFLSNLGLFTSSSAAGQFNGIKGLAYDGSDNLYVADSGNHRIQKFDAQSHFLLQWSVSQRSTGDIKDPYAMAVDLKGNVYVLDLQGVRKYDNRGQLLLSWGSPGPADNQFNSPRDIGIDEQGTVYILDSYSDGSRYQNPEGIVKKFDAQGHFLLKWDGGGNASVLSVDRQGNVLVQLTKYDTRGNYLANLYQNLSTDTDAGGLFKPALDKAGNIYTGSDFSNTVFKLDGTGKTLAKYYTYGRKDGQLRNPFSAAVDGTGNIYVYDGYNFRIQKFDKDGHFLLKWGSSGKEDGQFNSALVNLTVDDQGNVYSLDSASRRVQKFDSQGNLLMKLEGTNLGVSCQGSFTEPTLITVDSSGNIYVFDNYPGTSCVEKFNSEGHFLLQWGGGFGDKVGQFQKPTSMVVDRKGNFYITDGNYRICSYDTSGHLKQCWGSKGTNPDQFGGNNYLALDIQGNLYVTDAPNSIKKFDSQGKLLSVIGTGGEARAIAIDSQFNLYLVDSGNDRIQKFKLT